MKTNSYDQDVGILVIDDHAISRHFTFEALRQFTNNIRQARTGHEAISTTRNWFPGLIYTDIHLPDTCGLSLVQEIRSAWPQERNLPHVIVITGDCSSRLNAAGKTGQCCRDTPETRSNGRHQGQCPATHSPGQQRTGKFSTGPGRRHRSGVARIILPGTDHPAAHRWTGTSRSSTGSQPVRFSINSSLPAPCAGKRSSKTAAACCTRPSARTRSQRRSPRPITRSSGRHHRQKCTFSPYAELQPADLSGWHRPQSNLPNQAAISRTASSRPTKIERAMIECPMLSSIMCGRRATS